MSTRGNFNWATKIGLAIDRGHVTIDRAWQCQQRRGAFPFVLTANNLNWSYTIGEVRQEFRPRQTSLAFVDVHHLDSSCAKREKKVELCRNNHPQTFRKRIRCTAAAGGAKDLPPPARCGGAHAALTALIGSILSTGEVRRLVLQRPYQLTSFHQIAHPVESHKL
ncbi:hypothetical protein M514_00506 [Trichuris suis]|uniref:Uncharacterized protein n=1 Tax=Trichuris suis TaxID=68888 RepID=A0A085NRK7_9BILA|nr:hypothetical protein M513_00506 [Trichuris suis]KFD72103.1 hypothetical protein M514_00506 [Trichuris suis]